MRLANAAGRFGYGEAGMLGVCQRYGSPALTKAQLDAELLHLEKADLLRVVDKQLWPDRWATTARGDRWLTTSGLLSAR